MKKIIILTTLFFPLALLAQITIGTSQDEFKYLSKGYAYQKQMGLDGTKAGYSVKALFTSSNGVQFQGLFTTSQQFKGAIVIINPSTENPIYFGLPNNQASADLKEMAEKAMREKLNLNAKEKYDKALLELAMQQLQGGKMDTPVFSSTPAAQSTKTIPSAPNPNEVKEYNTIIPLKIENNQTLTKRSGETSTASTNQKVATSHNFSERSFIQPPLVKGQNPAAGTVVIKMCIDSAGNVKTAKFTQRGSSTFNATLRKMALDAAKEVKFTEGLEKEQCGTITFEFKI